MLQVDRAEFNSLMRSISKIDSGVSGGKPKLNKSRAEKFRKNTISDVKTGRLALKKNRPATEIIQNTTHPPEYFTGELLKSIDIKTEDNGSAEAGYFVSDQRRPASAKISYTDIATLQHTGYRIPLLGEKGERVRRWLAGHGVYVKKNKAFLIVSPRPFIFKSFDRSENSDDTEINKFMDNLWQTL